MTCPISHDERTLPVGRQHDEKIQKTVDQFERVAGSVFSGLFGVALFDQAMMPEISAGLEATRRIRNTPWLRALRTAASDQLIFHSDDPTLKQESDRLLALHRDVKGVSHDGVRYSALNPQSWNWVLYSTFFMQRGAYLAVTGRSLSSKENQAVWEWFRGRAATLELPGHSRLIESYDELEAHYARIATEKLEETSTLEAALTALRTGPRPPFVPAIADPAWRVASPVVNHVALLLGRGIMHPAARAHISGSWGMREEGEFLALVTILRVAFAVLPMALTETPLARNRRHYRKLVAKYQSVGLTSFAPDAILG